MRYDRMDGAPGHPSEHRTFAGAPDAARDFAQDDGSLGVSSQLADASRGMALEDVAERGFTIVRGVLTAADVDRMSAAVDGDIVQAGGRGGVRNLLDVVEFRELAESPALRRIAESILGDGAFVVRGILFDKTDAANWKVPWHQDVTIAVTDRVDVDEYGPWSVKAGVVHVQPPARVMERMVSVRLHLDDCPAENGALRVLPGTHRDGKLSAEQIDAAVAEVAPVTCEAHAGDVLVMRPLLVHASSAAMVPRHRRVIHFDYANVELAGGLEWRERFTSHVSESRHGAPG